MNPIVQSTNDVITYKFTVGNLSGKTIMNVTLSSDDLTLTNIIFDNSSFTVTVDSIGVTGSTQIESIITLSNSNVVNKCIKFAVGKQCF